MFIYSSFQFKSQSEVQVCFIFSPSVSETSDFCLLFLVVYFFGRWLWFLPISNPREAVGLHLFIPNSGLNLITGTCFGP